MLCRCPAPAPETTPSFESNEDGKPTDALHLSESGEATEESEINPVTAAEEL